MRPKSPDTPLSLTSLTILSTQPDLYFPCVYYSLFFQKTFKKV